MGLDETASLARPKCPNCDFIGVPGARFCSHCGTKLDESASYGATSAMPNGVPQEAVGGPAAISAYDMPESGAVLVVIRAQGEGPGEGTRFWLSDDIVRIGRDSNSTVFLDDITVSRNHAEMLHGTGGWLLRDKGSYNGTMVNGEVVDEIRLANGDEVQIGMFKFRFLVAE